MAEYKVVYIRTVYALYIAEIKAESEEDALDIVMDSKYGDAEFEETFDGSYSDDLEVYEVEILKGDK